MKRMSKFIYLLVGALALSNGTLAFGEVSKCVGADGRVLYGDDCPTGTEENKLKGTVSVGDKITAKPIERSGPEINLLEDSRAKEPKLRPLEIRNPTSN